MGILKVISFVLQLLMLLKIIRITCVANVIFLLDTAALQLNGTCHQVIQKISMSEKVWAVSINTEVIGMKKTLTLENPIPNTMNHLCSCSK